MYSTACKPLGLVAPVIGKCGLSLHTRTRAATKFRSFRGPAGHARGRHGVARRGPLPILGCPILPLWCRECP